jgi:DNA-binding NarL/FixJ family response regulator
MLLSSQSAVASLLTVPARGSVRVLVADDEPVFSEALATTLSLEARIEVVGLAENGSEAVALARKLEPDVILMDLEMPVMDGIQATRQIREELPWAVVIVVTGSDAAADVARARRAGAAAYVHKDDVAVNFPSCILARFSP